MAYNGVGYNTNTSYYDNVFSKFYDMFIRLAQIASKNNTKKEFIERVNSMLDSHYKLYNTFKEKHRNDPAGTDPYKEGYIDDLTKQYQTNINNDWTFVNSLGISNGFTTKRYKQYTKDATFKDNLFAGFQPDGIFSGITDDRRILGRLGDFTDELLAKIKLELNEYGYDIFLDSNEYYKLKEYVAEPVKPDESVEPVESVEPEGDESGDGQNGPEGNIHIPSGNGEGFDPTEYKNNDRISELSKLLGAARLYGTLINNNRSSKIYSNAQIPELKNPYDINSPVVGDYATRLLKFLQAALVRRLASKPTTADMLQHLAARLDAENQANQLEAEGLLADNKEIQRTFEIALKNVHDNIARRNDIANENAEELIENRKQKAYINATRVKENWSSVDNYLKGIETDLKSKEKETNTAKERLLETDLQLRIQRDVDPLLDQLDKYRREWQAAHPTDDTLPQEYYSQRQAIYNYKQQLLIQGWGNIYKVLINSKPIVKPEIKPFKEGGKIRKNKVTPKFAKGGDISNIFNVYEAVTLGDSSDKKSSSGGGSSKSDDKELTKKKLAEWALELIKDLKVLPSDRRELAPKIANFLTEIELSSDSAYDINRLLIQYARLQNEIQNAIFSKDKRDKAYDEVKSNGGYTEIAISESNELFYIENGTLQSGSPQELLNKNAKPLTNRQLLDYRDYVAGGYNFSTDEMFGTIANGIGMKQVNDMIKDLINLGNEKRENTEYFGGKGDEFANNIDELVKFIKENPGVQLDLIWKIKEVAESNENAIKSALLSIYQQLPDNAKTLLEYKSGNSEDPQKGAMTMIYGMLQQRLNTSYSRTIELDGGTAGSSDKKGKGKGESDGDDLTIGERWFQDLMAEQVVPIRPKSSQSGYLAKATVGPLLNKDGNSLSPYAKVSIDTLFESTYAPYFDGGQMSVGGVPVKQGLAGTVILADNNVRKVQLPAKKLPNGQIVPDTDIIDMHDHLRTVLLKHNINVDDPESIKKNWNKIDAFCKQYPASKYKDGYTNIFKKDGTLNCEYLNFALINVEVMENALDKEYIQEAKDKEFLRPITDKASIDAFELAIKDISKDHIDVLDNGELWGMSKSNELYEGVLYIPLIANHFAASKGISPEQSVKNKAKLSYNNNYH